MNQYFGLNILVVGLIALGIVVTGNPLFVLLLLMLRDMPHYPPQRLVDHELAMTKLNASNGPYQTNAVGFTGFVGGNDDEGYEDRKR